MATDTDTPAGLDRHPVVSHDAWTAARTALLAKEKAFTRLRDELSRERRALPWERVEKTYAFDAPGGRVTLADLFAGRSQLVIYHFMFNPEADQGCASCSFWADNFDPIVIHLSQRDVSFAAVSRAPVPKLERFRERMGWHFRWVSSGGSDFNYDLGVSFTPEQVGDGTAVYNYQRLDQAFADREGVSVFYRDPAGAIFHTYSSYARGIDFLNTAYNYLDLAPKGRDEDGLSFTQAWVRHHDRYQD
ncbi:MAG: DUF899 domain-containing protein [Gemmatimonadales bacterium]